MTDRLLARLFVTGRDACLGWTARRLPRGGAPGAAILQLIFALRWARREPDSRAVTFTTFGDRSFRAVFEEREKRARGGVRVLSIYAPQESVNPEFASAKSSDEHSFDTFSSECRLS